MPELKWNANLYDDKYAFVSKYGEDLIGWLAPQKGESILDVGCGTGQLAAEIAEYGARVTGMDQSPQMIEKARAAYPGLPFDVKDVRDFTYGEPFDALFSNAMLHWVDDQEAAIASMYLALKPGGRLVLEMGGKGNVQEIIQALEEAMWEAGCRERLTGEGWYFPSIGEYTSLLEKGGFRVTTALHFDRETPLEGGMEGWIRMFGGFLFRLFSPEETNKIIARAVELLKPGHYRGGAWYADYKRLRIKAVK
ncbi:class I SAM-dependent methyltransferase [Dinghuibacter silviterrae]|uniref:Trans-aconitate methyltransferase n=1 Tax=Dinghuibacter silviterrae TaxID=1539049 RepID=A0A4R8DJ21_9BACT|nr:class I SAM-dependent methyltransferase [Dinghuibacter silviterrae]TDW97324.1 trans-aconitate methyltransferase [Dinghuibacter silviterrae]